MVNQFPRRVIITLLWNEAIWLDDASRVTLFNQSECIISEYSREMEYIEQASSNTFYPFQNKHQIHRNLQIVKMLCPLKNQNEVESRSHKMGQAIKLPIDF